MRRSYVSDGVNFFVSPEAPTTVWDGKWHVLAGSFDGSTIRFYVDGTQIGTGTRCDSVSIGYGLSSVDGSQIGNFSNDCGLTFKGDIDEVSIWNAALPFNQIWANVFTLLTSNLR